MNYSGYVPGQLPQQTGDRELHVIPTTLGQGGMYPHQLAQAAQQQHSLAQGLAYQHPSGGFVHGGDGSAINAFAVPTASGTSHVQVQVNPAASLASNMLSYLTSEAEAGDQQQQGQERDAPEASGVGTVLRAGVQGPTVSPPQENRDFYRDDDHQASSLVSSATSVHQGSREPHLTQQPVGTRKVRKPLSEGTLNTASAGQPSRDLYPSLPGGLKYRLSDSDGVRSVVGVLAGRVIEMGEKFGPFTGCLLDEEAGQDIESAWEICVRGRVKHYVDGKDRIHKNWLIHVRPARTKEEQNLEAFQSYGDIFFRAVDTIHPGTELKVFYCKEYREKIGCSTTLGDMNFKRSADIFECKDCKATCESSKSMMRHLKSHQTSEDNSSKQHTRTRSRIERNRISYEDLGQVREKSNIETGEPQETRSNEGHSSSQATNQDISETTRKLYQYVLHDGGKEDANLQKNVLARKQRLHIANFRRQSPSVAPARNKADMPSIVRCKKSSGDETTEDWQEAGEQEHRDIESGSGKEISDCVCETCGKTFSSSGKLAAHKLFHESTTEFRCTECDFVCKTSQTLQRHVNSHADRPFKCELCTTTQYGYQSNWMRHMQNAHSIHVKAHKGTYTYYCNACKFPSSNVKLVQKHLLNCVIVKSVRKAASRKRKSRREKRDENSVLEIEIKEEVDDDVIEINDSSQGCTRMENSSDTGWLQVGSLFLEGDSHQEDPGRLPQEGTEEPGETSGSSQAASKNLECKFCSKSFAVWKYLQNHIKVKHKRWVKYKCDFCPNVFRDRPAQLIHMRRHTKDRPYKCLLCPHSFSSESAYNKHQLGHTDAMPFKCEPCHKGFSTKKKLYNHWHRVHQTKDRDKQFPCSMCERTFRTKAVLRKHEERHLGIKPFKCEVCGKGLSTKDTLKKHMTTHSEEKPFECKICSMRFRLNQHLGRHALVHLKDIEAKSKS